jgi:hypothetical protein
MFEVSIFVALAWGVSSCLCSVCDIISWDTVAFFAFWPVGTVDEGRILWMSVRILIHFDQTPTVFYISCVSQELFGHNFDA